MSDYTKIAFGTKSAADAFRESTRQWLAESDDGRCKTVRFRPDTPENVLLRATEAAADSKCPGEKATRTPLTARERAEIDFARSDMNIPKARWLKGIADYHGVTDWMRYADYRASVGENRRILKRASREERGNRGGRGSDVERTRAMGRALRYRPDQVKSAIDAALRGDKDAIEFLRDQAAVDDRVRERMKERLERDEPIAQAD